MEAEIAALKSKIEQKDSDLQSSLKGQDILKAENNNLKSMLDDHYMKNKKAHYQIKG